MVKIVRLRHGRAFLENELVELDPIEQKKLKLFQTVDELMEGQAEQQKLAFDLLNSQGKTY